MHYEINVSKNGYHYFATHERSIQTEEQMKEIVHLFKQKFPESEGYKITCTRWETQGTPIDIK
jgi:hypothetical protein